ncbi:MAG: DUF1553 domain-containing protein [Planctomycetes bacterium]|nr:DUF1553 domain-containing protein [Planctomycetota bacterium]
MTLLMAAVWPVAASAQDTAAKVAFFEKRVRPIFAQQCYGCHSESGGKVKGELAFDRVDKLLAGGTSGPLVVPGKPDESRLIRAVRYHDSKLKMPPSGALPKHQVDDLIAWVADGAIVPKASAKTDLSVEAGRKHWAFQPLKSRAAPVVKNKEWVKKPIDAWILLEMEKQGLSPSQPAARRVMLRRLSFDLTGLPPTPAEMEAFAKDDSPNAYSKAVDRLLASPHYGERWGRHWLDLARYCDIGESWVEQKGSAYFYRDWVVQAINADIPYDRFVQMQLAADQLPNSKPGDLAALGFMGLSPNYWKELQLSPSSIKVVVAEEWEERIATLTSTFLGLTVACARCHDHKHDPISNADYYAMAGIINSTRLVDRLMLPEPLATKVRQAQAAIAQLEAKLKPLQAKKPLTDESMKQIADLQAEIKKIQAETPEFNTPMTRAVEDAALEVLPAPNGTKLVYKPEASNVMMQMRGNPAAQGPEIPRRFLTVLSKGEPRPFTQGSGRAQLAKAMVTEAAPLTARVFVNRVWKHHFGRGLSETPSDFGFQGDRPSHPELLDDLTARFVANGWSLKWLHREIVLSTTYQQASNYDESKFQKDPDNRYLWRMNRRRLDAESWRDAMLATTGTLDLTIGGAPLPQGDLTNNRRTLYGTVKRRELNDYLRLHDFPDPTTHTPQRLPTTTPLQQLFALNSPLMLDQSKAFVQRLKKDAPNAEGQVRRAFLLAYGREASDAQVKASLAFLTAGMPNGPIADASWLQFAQAVLGSNEFQFLD